MATFLRGEKRGRSARFERTKDGFQFTESRTYVVISDDSRESPVIVASTAGLPVPGITATLSGAICRSLNPQQDEKQPKVWNVQAEFSTEPLNQQVDKSGTPDPNPLNWVPIYRGAIETYPQVLSFDKSSPKKPYVNSAFDKFPEPLVRHTPVIVYEFSQYEAANITDKQIGDRNESTNSTVFKGFPAWTLKLNVKGFERGWYFGYECVKIDYRVAYRPGEIDGQGDLTGWKDIPLDMGYSYFTAPPASGGKKVNSLVLVALNPDGTKMADDSEPFWKIFKGLTEIDFNTFLRR